MVLILIYVNLKIGEYVGVYAAIFEIMQDVKITFGTENFPKIINFKLFTMVSF